MPDIGSGFAKAGFVLVTLGLLSGCNSEVAKSPPIEVPLYQKWELQPGDAIDGHKVIGGLGDISIVLNGNPVYAPFEGEAHVDKRGCLYFSTPNIPSYLFRLCGLRAQTLGRLQQGQEIGTGEILQFAALRKQPDGKWALVEPDKSLVERTLKKQ